MAVQSFLAVDSEAEEASKETQPNHREILRQLERVAGSALFRNSKRYPAFLRYIVEHTLSGHADMLKERTLGIEVFGRSPDYDTNADPVVRVTAGEIRKRLAQYYLCPGREQELRFDLPVGSYVPHFAVCLAASTHLEVAAHEPAKATAAVAGLPAHELPPADAFTTIPKSDPAELLEPPARSAAGRGPVRWLLVCLLALVVMLGCLVPWMVDRQKNAGKSMVWRPFLNGDAPTLVVLGVHSLGPDGRDLSPVNYAMSASKDGQSMLSSMIRSDMVPVSDIVSYSALISVLARSAHAFKTQSAAATTFEQLQHGPVVLVGGLDNLWTLRLTSGLRYRFVCHDRDPVGAIVDRDHPEREVRFDSAQAALANSQDYAIVASFFEPQIEQHVLIAAGIGKNGTAAAANFLTDKAYLRKWFAGPRGNQRNVEFVLSTQVVEGQQGPPHVLAEYAW